MKFPPELLDEAIGLQACSAIVCRDGREEKKEHRFAEILRLQRLPLRMTPQAAGVTPAPSGSGRLRCRRGGVGLSCRHAY
jgi:hypothetical protein